MRSAILALATLPGTARAASPVTAGEEIVVRDAFLVERSRLVIEGDLERLGYEEGRRDGERTIYLHEVSWKPTVVIHDDGAVTIRRGPVRFVPWIPGRSKLRYLGCLPPLIINCIRLGGQFISPHKLTPQKQRVLDTIDPHVDAWHEALSGRAMALRFAQELPAQLTSTWEEGAPLEPGSAPLPTPTERRQAILGLWAHRSCTPEGDAARAIIRDFVVYEVQFSSFPATAEEMNAANKAQRCTDVPRLPLP